jgi:DHA1 family tetracycline resistance protein-like MFS transporter
MLLFCFAGRAVDYLVMAFTPYLWLLLAGRAVGGLTGAYMGVATAYVADITPEEARAHRLGRLNAFFNVGFVLGSAIGGLVGDIWLRAPFLAAFALNAANLAVGLFVLSESHAPERTPLEWRALNPIEPLHWALTFRALVPLLAVFALICLVSQSYSTVWVLFTEDRFQWGPAEIGLSLAVFGTLVAVAQGFAVGPATRWLGERGALLLGLAIESAGLLLLAAAHTGWMAYLAVVPIAFGQIATPALQTLQVNTVGPERQGQLQGVIASLTGLTAVTGPMAFGWIYDLSGGSGSGLVWICCVAIYAFSVPVLLAVPKSAGSATPR